MADRIGWQIGNYRLVALIGQGAFAEVYLGEHVHITMRAAIKMLHGQLTEEYKQGFLDEAQALSQLVHPHIVRMFDFGVDPVSSSPYIVMDYAPQGTMRKRYPRGERVPPDEIIRYAKQLAQALQFAHDRNLLHRDLKPENLLLDAQDMVLLSDFGVVALAHSTASLQTSNYAGTYAYSAPEQLAGKPRKESDQYALGIIILEWFLGTLPFTGTVQEIISQHLIAPPPLIRDTLYSIPAEVDDVIGRALAKKPQDRFPRVLDFVQALESAYLQSSLSTLPGKNQSQGQRNVDTGIATVKNPGAGDTIPSPRASSVTRPVSYPTIPLSPASTTFTQPYIRPPKKRTQTWWYIGLCLFVVVIIGGFVLGGNILGKSSSQTTNSGQTVTSGSFGLTTEPNTKVPVQPSPTTQPTNVPVPPTQVPTSQGSGNGTGNPQPKPKSAHMCIMTDLSDDTVNFTEELATPDSSPSVGPLTFGISNCGDSGSWKATILNPSGTIVTFSIDTSSGMLDSGGRKQVTVAATDNVDPHAGNFRANGELDFTVVDSSGQSNTHKVMLTFTRTVDATFTVNPQSAAFSVDSGAGVSDLTKTFTVLNLGWKGSLTITISDPSGATMTCAIASANLDTGATTSVTCTLAETTLAVGSYSGEIDFQMTTDSTTSRTKPIAVTYTYIKK